MNFLSGLSRSPKEKRLGLPIGGMGGLIKKCCRIVALALKFVQYCTLLLIVHHTDIPTVFDCELLWNTVVT